MNEIMIESVAKKISEIIRDQDPGIRESTLLDMKNHKEHFQDALANEIITPISQYASTNKGVYLEKDPEDQNVYETCAKLVMTPLLSLFQEDLATVPTL